MGTNTLLYLPWAQKGTHLYFWLISCIGSKLSRMSTHPGVSFAWLIECTCEVLRRIHTHEISSQEINSHQINFSRDQLQQGQLPPDQLLIKVVMKCDSVWVNVDSRGVPLQWSVPLQRIVHFKEMHHFKHYSVINHCHISISKVQLVVVAGIHTWKNKSSQYFWDYWCDVKGASYHRDENQLVWSQHYAKFVQRDVKLSTLRDFRMEDAT